MEVLTTYVRMHSPVKENQDRRLSPHSEKLSTNSVLQPAIVTIDVLSPDIQAILTVIGRRERGFEQGKHETLDLSNTDLAKAKLVVADLNNADLNGANLAGYPAVGIPPPVGLTQEMLNSARGSEDTKLPYGWLC